VFRTRKRTARLRVVSTQVCANTALAKLAEPAVRRTGCDWQVVGLEQTESGAPPRESARSKLPSSCTGRLGIAATMEAGDAANASREAYQAAMDARVGLEADGASAGDIAGARADTAAAKEQLEAATEKQRDIEATCTVNTKGLVLCMQVPSVDVAERSIAAVAARVGDLQPGSLHSQNRRRRRRRAATAAAAQRRQRAECGAESGVAHGGGRRGRWGGGAAVSNAPPRWARRSAPPRGLPSSCTGRLGRGFVSDRGKHIIIQLPLL
jgi:hypothetical protein